MNACFDATNIKANPSLQHIFSEELKKIETHILLNFKNVPAQTIVDAAYYFCKF